MVSAIGLILSGVLVELIRARRRQDTVVHEVKPNGGGSLRDAVTRLAGRFDKLDEKQDDFSTRLTRMETRMEYLSPTRMVNHGE